MFRGHLLLEKCLNGMLVSEVMDQDSEFTVLVDAYEETYTSTLAGDRISESILSELKVKVEPKLVEKNHRRESCGFPIWQIQRGPGLRIFRLLRNVYPYSQQQAIITGVVAADVDINEFCTVRQKNKIKLKERTKQNH